MKIYLTLDYELFFGKNTGTQEESIVNPTYLLIELLNKYNVKASFFVDSGYLIKLEEFKKKYSNLEKDYNRIIEQITILHNNGHDIQLHIHPHWEDSFYDGEKWVLDTKRYRLHSFNEDDIKKIVFNYKNVLTNIVGNKIFVFRGGGWCIQPFGRLKSALKENSISLDSTVYANGYNSSDTHYYDFRSAPNQTIWTFDEDPLVEDVNGYFTEIPISSFRVPPSFYWKFAFIRKFGRNKYKKFGNGSAVGSSTWDKIKMLIKSSNSVVSIDGYRAVFLEKAFKIFSKIINNKHFVIIGHPKALSPYSLEMLELFLKKYHTSFTTYSKEFDR